MLFFPAMGGFDVHDVKEPPADEEGEQGVDGGVGEHPAYGIFAELWYSQPGEPAGAVAEEVVGCEGHSCDLGEQDLLRSSCPHDARAGGEHSREQAPERPDSEEVAAEGVEEYTPEEAEQHGLEIPQWGDSEDDRDQGQPWREEAEGQVGYHDGVEERGERNDDRGADDGGLLHRLSLPLPAGPVDDYPHLFEVLGVHGRVHYYLLELLYVLRADRLDLTNVEARREQELLVSGPPAGNDEVALLDTRLEAYQVDPEVSLEVRLQKPLAVGDVLGRDGRAKLPGSWVELGGRDDPDPRREHLVRDKHDLGRMFGDLCGAPDQRVLADYHRPVGFDAVLGAHVENYPLGELIPYRGDDLRERAVLVDGPLSLQELAKAGVLALEAGRLGREGLGLPQLALEPLLLSVVEGALHALVRPLQRLEEGGEDAARRLQYLGRAELDRMQGPARILLLRAVTLFDVDGEERDA